MEEQILKQIQHITNEKSILIENGNTSMEIVDSITSVKLASFLEETYVFEFEDEKLSLKAFDTVKDLIAYVKAQISETEENPC